MIMIRSGCLQFSFSRRPKILAVGVVRRGRFKMPFVAQISCPCPRFACVRGTEVKNREKNNGRASRCPSSAGVRRLEVSVDAGLTVVGLRTHKSWLLLPN